MLFAEKWQISPFEVLNQDVDDFILIANSLIEGKNTENEKSKKSTAISKKDAFWDF